MLKNIVFDFVYFVLVLLEIWMVSFTIWKRSLKKR